MKLKDTIFPVIMLLALFGMIVVAFNLPVGMGTKQLGVLVFGAILVFGVFNLALVVLDSVKKKGP